MKPSPTLRQRLRYRFDNALSAGIGPVLLWLAGVTLAMLIVCALILVIGGVNYYDDGGTLSFVEALWQTFLRALDAGTMGGDLDWSLRVVSLIVTLGGIFILSTLIGLIANAISDKLDELRKGRSPVLEHGHTLILGWSPKLLSIVSELMIANDNQPGSRIVVMAPEDKVFMEDEIRTRVTANRYTKVICRNGSTADPHDLEIVNPVGSRAVIVLSPEGDGADAHVMKTVLALMHFDPMLATIKVVAELQDPDNAKALESTTEGRVLTVVASEVISRITAQVCRRSGLSAVYQELLDFDGDELYFSADPRTQGMSFGDVLMAYETSTIIGVRFADGRVALRPPMSTTFSADDKVVAVSADDDTVVFSDAGGYPAYDGIGTVVPLERLVKRLLILGWNSLGPLVVRQLDKYLGPGSEVIVVYDPEHVGAGEVEHGDEYSNVTLTWRNVEGSEVDALDHVLSEGMVDHVVIFCYRAGLSASEADARSLMTLLQVRQMLKRMAPDRHVGIVTELLEVADVELGKIANPDDFIVSEQLVGLLLTQLAENPELEPVFSDLFDTGDSEIELRPLSDYVSGDGRFSDAVIAARARGEVAMGFRKVGDGPGEVVVNPRKDEPLPTGPGHQLIVLVAE